MGSEYYGNGCLGENGLFWNVVEGGPGAHQLLSLLTKLQPGLQHQPARWEILSLSTPPIYIDGSYFATRYREGANFAQIDQKSSCEKSHEKQKGHGYFSISRIFSKLFFLPENVYLLVCLNFF